MNVPHTIAGALVVVLALLPGLPGDYVFRLLAGVSWREKDLQYLLRLIAFSALGLAAYVGLADWTGMPMPDYVVPATFGNFDSARLPSLSFAYVAHFFASSIVGAAAAYFARATTSLRARSALRDTWDHFVHCAVPGHWVVVALRDGSAYAGYVDHADVATDPASRDVLLAEPYRFDTRTGRYEVTYNQYLFISGRDIASVAVVHEANERRVVPVNEMPFLEFSNGKEDIARSAAASSDQGGLSARASPEPTESATSDSAAES